MSSLSIQKNKADFGHFLVFLAIFSVASIFLSFFFTFQIFSPLLVFLALAIGVIVFSNPKLGLMLLILIRPSLDILTNFNVLSANETMLNFSSLLAILTVVFFIFVLFDKYKIVKKIGFNWKWVFFLLISLFSVFLSVDKMLGIAEWIRLFGLFSIFMLVPIFVGNIEDFKKILWVIVYSALLPSIFAFYQFVTDKGMTIPLEGISNRIYGTFAHPNLFAYYLLIPISILCYFISKKEKPAFSILLASFYGLMLILTFTRGAWMALVLIFLIIGIAKYRKALAVLAIIFILIYAVAPPIRDRVNSLTKSSPDSSIQWRKNLWLDSIAMIDKKPLLGYGTGTASKVIMETRGPQFGSSDSHNDYLKLTLESGIVGLLAYIILLFSVLFKLGKKYLFNRNRNYSNFILIVFALSLSLFIMSFADNVLRNTALQWSFWSLVSLGFVIDWKKANLKK